MAISKPIFTLDQIITQLTTTWSEADTAKRIWSSLDTPTIPLSTISFGINTDSPTNFPSASFEAEGLINMTPVQVFTARLSFQTWDSLIAASLVEDGSANANITLNYSSTTYGNGTYSKYQLSNALPNVITANQIWLSSTWESNQDSGLINGGYGLFTIMHEIGHAIGLSHPGNYNVQAAYSWDAVFSQDNRQYTIMSYFGGYDEPTKTWFQDGTYLSYLYPQTPMLYDIAAIQSLYGADLTTRIGDTIYGYHCNFLVDDLEKSIFDFLNNTHPIFTIWDAGGNDTLDCSGWNNGDQIINLAPGSYSSVCGLNENISIAFGAIIEAAIGGNGNDIITGNTANNNLSGNAGDDSLNGGEGGNDTLIGGDGNDVLTGGIGDDTYILSMDDNQDVIDNWEYGYFMNFDRVYFTDVASTDINAFFQTPSKANGYNAALIMQYGINGQLNIDYYLNDPSYRIDQFQFSDGITWDWNDLKRLAQNQGDEQLTGSAGDDELFGYDGNDTLLGGAGNDYLEGGAGIDTYLISKTDGQDEIYNWNREAYIFLGIEIINADIVQFIDVASTDISAKFRDPSKPNNNDGDLILQYGVDGQLRIDNYFLDFAYKPKLQFSDGITWDWTVGNVLDNLRLVGTVFDDAINGYTYENNLISGLAGNDQLYGGYDFIGAEIGVGDEELGWLYINGEAGRDTLIGGLGNDTMTGYVGADIYIIAKADGQDVIYNYDTGIQQSPQFIDIVQFSDVESTEIKAKFRDPNSPNQNDGHLILQYGVDGQLLVDNYYFSPDYRRIQFQFANGVTWGWDELKALGLVGTIFDDNITGYDSDDNLYGDDGHDYLAGGTGDDTLDGGNGYDTLIGDIGNDTLIDGNGGDMLRGGEGDDIYIINQANVIDPFDFIDTIIIDNTGNDFRDSNDLVKFVDVTSTEVTALFQYPNLFNNDNAALILEYGANRRLLIDHYFNDPGYRVDQIQFSDGVILSWDDLKAVGPNQGDDQLIGGAGDDELFGYDGNDTLLGGAGNDYLVGGVGSDTYIINKNEGQDVINNQNTDSPQVIDSVQFTDITSTSINAKFRDPNYPNQNNGHLILQYGVDGQLRVDNYFFSPEYRAIQFQFADGITWSWNELKALGLIGTAFNDTITGYDGDDNLTGDNGNDILDGGTGNDSLYGDNGNDWLYGNIGNDSLNGGSGDDHLFGNGGDDALFGNDGDDELFGNEGDNNLNGGNGNDSLFGDTGNNTLVGGNGNDTLFGGTGNGSLIGGDGDDNLNGSSGNDTLFGDIGNDVLIGGSGDDALNGGDGNDGLSGIYGKQTMNGGRGDDNLSSGDDDDILSGDEGNDTLYAGSGNDTLSGSDGNDMLYGNDGNDMLIGGNGLDTFTISQYDGLDEIDNFDTDYSLDVVQFTDCAITDVTVIKNTGANNNNLTFTYGFDSQLTIQGFFIGLDYGVDRFDFIDGSWNYRDIVNNISPTASNQVLTTNEDTPFAFAVNNFGFSDNDAGDTLQLIQITRLPVAGSLKLNGVSVTSNQMIKANDINNGQLVFTPEINSNGNNYANFNFNVSDGFGFSSSDYLMTVNITPVNDAPITGDQSVTTYEDNALILTVNHFYFNDIDAGSSLQALQITRLPTAGSLSFDGVAVTENQIINVADLNASKLVFTPQANATGNNYANFNFTVSDGAAFALAASTLTVNVVPVNDAPTASNVFVTTNEDTALMLAAQHFGFNDIDAGSSLQALQITRLPTAGSLSFDGVAVTENQIINVADLNAGKLVFTPLANANGNNYANFNFKVSDGAAFSRPAYILKIKVLEVRDDMKLVGTLGDDILKGDLIDVGSYDHLSGLSGNDKLFGAGGNDTLLGGSGNDNLVGGSGNDFLIGGLGKDSYNLTETTATTDTLRIAVDDSLVYAFDIVSSFKLGVSETTNEGVDRLDLDNINIATDVAIVDGINKGSIFSHSINNGIIRFDDENRFATPLTLVTSDLGYVIKYLQANITAGETVAFVAHENSYVFQDNGSNDILVRLTGVIAEHISTTGLTANTIWLV